MKIRLGFVTNSSSSSFIVAFKNKADKDATLAHIKELYGTAVAERLSEDVQHYKCDKQHVLQNVRHYFENDAKYRYLYHNKDYYSMSEVEFFKKYPDIQKEMKQYVQQKLDEVKAKIPQKGYLAEVSYSDNDGTFFSEMEHDIMPYLTCTVVRMSHH